MRITALGRGGLGVYQGLYDPHKDEAVVQIRDGETIGVTIVYPSTPSAMSTSANGITASTPTITGSQAALTLSDMDDNGYVDVLATVGGQIRTVRIRTRNGTPVEDYGCPGELV